MASEMTCTVSSGALNSTPAKSGCGCADDKDGLAAAGGGHHRENSSGGGAVSAADDEQDDVDEDTVAMLQFYDRSKSFFDNISCESSERAKGSVTCHGVVAALEVHFSIVPHPFNCLFSGTTWVSRYQKGKTSLDLNDARDDGVLGCSGISWTICKQSAPRSRQITTPTPHQSIVYRLDALPDAQPTVSKH